MGFREARQQAGLSVLEVAKRLGVSDAAVYMWETGTTVPTTKRLVQIAALYNVPIEQLLQDSK